MDNRDHQSSIVPKIAADLSLNRTNLTGRGLSLANEIKKDSTLKHDLQNELRLTLVPGLDMDFVRIPDGHFLMSSGDSEFSQEKPLHKVYLDEYWISKFPITNMQYIAFLEYARRYSLRMTYRYQIKKIDSLKEKLNYPIADVDWYDARDFCQWVTEITGKNVRLPTETEWEKAARGTDGREYPWGNNQPNSSLCNFTRNIGTTTPVDRYSPACDSPYGVVDMVGNIWEWTGNIWYVSNTDKSDSRIDNYRDKDDSKRHRILKGGSWLEASNLISISYRSWYNQGYSSINIGFRCVLSSL